MDNLTENMRRCVLWIGDKHSGKTTAAANLVKRLQQQSYSVGGILAPSIYQNGRLIGFDIIDIKNGFRIPLAVRNDQQSDIGVYQYFQKGLKVGHSALNVNNNQSSDLVIVDEFGPWELEGNGWRTDVDCLLEKEGPPVLLVVRQEIADQVRQLYSEDICFSLNALESGSIERILAWLQKQ